MHSDWQPLELLAQRTRNMLVNMGGNFAPPSQQVFRLAGGVPDPVVFPTEELIEAFSSMLRQRGELALQYGGMQGNQELREALAAMIGRREGMPLTADHFMLTNGASQALENACFALLDPGDVVISENPTFTLSLRTIAAHQAEVIGVPLEAEGPDIKAVEAAFGQAQRQGKRVKFIYVTPNFQNPTGITFSIERRRQLLELAERQRCLIVEDDAYGELRYDGQAPPSFFTLAAGRGVIRMGTFSKTIGPGLRLGWSQAEPELTQALVAMRMDMGSPPLVTYLVSEYVASGAFERHVQEVIHFYREKRDHFLSALAEHFEGLGRWSAPEGGFFVWLELPEGVDCGLAAEAAMAEGVMVAPGARFYCQDPRNQHLRLAFSFIDGKDIDEAIARLARAVRNTIRR